jgi:cation diffusion facilitator family transporter
MKPAGERKKNAAWLSVIANASLTAMKLIIGVISGSMAIISEAFHSGVDLLAAVIALLAVKISDKPSDHEHPFGHGKFENLSGTIEAFLIFLAAGWIIYESVLKLIKPEPLDNLGWGIGIMFVSTVVNIVLTRTIMKTGKETDSMALIADAWHHLTDVWTSLGVFICLVLIWGGEMIFVGTHFHWLDPLAAIGVAILIIHAAFKLSIQSGRDLIDTRLPEEEEIWIRRQIEKFRPSVYGFHRLLTRKSGATRFVEFHLLVNSRMSVEESHRICDDITAAIEKQFAGTNVNIHIEPCDGLCAPSCSSDCMKSEEERKILRGEMGKNRDIPGSNPVENR